MPSGRDMADEQQPGGNRNLDKFKGGFGGTATGTGGSGSSSLVKALAVGVLVVAAVLVGFALL